MIIYVLWVVLLQPTGDPVLHRIAELESGTGCALLASQLGDHPDNTRMEFVCKEATKI